MAEMNMMMVDTETTGVDPEDNGLRQLAAIKFNLDTFEVGASFDRCPSLLPRRHWSASTRKFWKDHPEVDRELMMREEPAEQVFRDFLRFCSDGNYTFVAKPAKFDWPFVESHLTQLGLPMPFAHWKVLDLHSYVMGLRGATSRVDIESEVPFNGKPHNALHDAAYQIDLLFHAKRNHIAAEMA